MRADRRVDTTLATLVPRQSIVRNVAAVVIAGTLLVGVGAAPEYVRPAVTYGHAGSSLIRASASVLTENDLWVTSKSDAEVVGVGPAPGADLVGVWMFRGPESEAWFSLSEAEAEDPLRALQVRYGGAAALEDHRLPQHLGAGERAYLILLWKITDCSALVPGFVPDLTIRSAWGMSATVPLTDTTGPSSSTQMLVDFGVCDATTTPGDPPPAWMEPSE